MASSKTSTFNRSATAHTLCSNRRGSMQLETEGVWALLLCDACSVVISRARQRARGAVRACVRSLPLDPARVRVVAELRLFCIIACATESFSRAGLRAWPFLQGADVTPTDTPCA